MASAAEPDQVPAKSLPANPALWRSLHSNARPRPGEPVIASSGGEIRLWAGADRLLAIQLEVIDAGTVRT